MKETFGFASKNRHESETDVHKPSAPPLDDIIDDDIDFVLGLGNEPQVGSDDDEGNMEPEYQEEARMSELINSFQKDINVFPTFVCPICRRKTYNTKYCKESFQFTPKTIEIMRSYDFYEFQESDNVIMCRRCKDNLKRGNVPSTYHLNKMTPPQPGKYLAQLNDIELRFISQVKPFKRIYKLQKNRGQFGLKGSCVHFPQSIEDCIENLPLTRDTADILIVKEKHEGKEYHKQFQVRGKLLVQALQELKETNIWYRGINIVPISEEELQVAEVFVQEPKNNDDEARNHILSQKSSGYLQLSMNRMILRAKLHQDSLPSFRTNACKCAAFCAASIALHAIHSIDNWSSQDLANLMFWGNSYYTKLVPERNRYLRPTESTGIVNCYQAVDVQCEVEPTLINGHLNKAPGNRTRLIDAITNFMESQRDVAILETNYACMALIQTTVGMYLFDPHSRGPSGHACQNHSGSACVVKFDFDNCSDQISWIIHRNCVPKGAHTEEMDHYYEFFLHPVNYSVVQKEVNDEHDQQCEPNETVPEARESHGYVTICNDRMILRATMHQGSINIMNNQCSAMSAIALAHSIVINIDLWNIELLDQILIAGDSYYVSLVPTRDSLLSAEETNGICTLFDGSRVECTAEGTTFDGFLNVVENNPLRLKSAIQQFIESEFLTAILTTHGMSMGLIKTANHIYLFDSHARAPNGYLAEGESGVACVVKYTLEKGPSQISRQVHKNCDLDTNVRKHLDEQGMVANQYALIPINCTFDASRLPTKTVVENKKSCFPKYPEIIGQNHTRQQSQQTSAENFEIMTNGRSILRATTHQGAINIMGNQCSALCTTAIAYTIVRPVDSWSTSVLDNVLYAGDRYYAVLVTERDRMLNAEETNGICTLQDGHKVNCVADTRTFDGFLRQIPGAHLPRLKEAIIAFIESEFQNAVLTTREVSMALLKYNNHIYLFDSHERGPHGETCGSDTGVACVSKYTFEAGPTQISQLVQNNCAPNDIQLPQDDLNYHICGLYQFTIIPIVCTLVNCEIINEPMAESQARKIQSNPIPVRPCQNKSSAIPVPINAVLNPNQIQLDTVLRCDNPVEPTLEAVMNAAQNNRNVADEVEFVRRRGAPIYPEKERRAEELGFVRQYPTGEFGFSEFRKKPITTLDFFQQRILGDDDRFHGNEYLFYALCRFETDAINKKIAVCEIWLQIMARTTITTIVSLYKIHICT